MDRTKDGPETDGRQGVDALAWRIGLRFVIAGVLLRLASRLIGEPRDEQGRADAEK